VTTGGATGPSGYSTAYVFLGAASYSIRQPVVRQGETADDGFGAAVASGDFNGDGRSDLAVGAPRFDLGPELLDAGKVYEWSGTPSGLAAAPASARVGTPGHRFASTVAAAGDLNGDGYGDLVVGAPMASADGPLTNGQFFAYFGGTSGLSSSYDFTEAGAAGNDLFGATAAGVGDMDGDGADDLAVAAPGRDGSGHADAGAIYLYGGSRLRLPAAGVLIALPDLTDGAALARRISPYHAVVTVVHRGPAADLTAVELHMASPATGRQVTIFWQPAAGITLAAGDEALLEIAPDTAVGDSSEFLHAKRFSMGLRFGWAMDEPQGIDLEAIATAGDSLQSTAWQPAALRVVARLAFSAPIAASGQDGRAVASGAFVRAGEVLEWSGGSVVYEGTSTVPSLSEFFVRVGGGLDAPTRATVEASTGAISARRAAPAAGSPPPGAFVEAVSGDGGVLARADYPLSIDGSPVSFGAPNPPSGSTLSEGDIEVSIPIADAGAGVDPVSVEWSLSHSDPPVFDDWAPAVTTGASPVVATAAVHLETQAPNFLQFRAADRVGNGPAYSPAIRLMLDYGAVEFGRQGAPMDGWLRTGDVSASFLVSNTRGVAIDLSTVEYMVASPVAGPWQSAGLTGTAPDAAFTLRLALADGTHTVSLRASLVEGGLYQSRAYSFQVDATDPTVQVLAPTPGQWTTEHTITARVFVDDATSGVDTSRLEYRYLPPGATVWGPWQAPTVQVAPQGVYASAVLRLADGTDNFIEWRVSDLAGNGPAGSGYLRLLVDTRPVQFGTPVPADGARLEAVDRLSISVADRDGSGVDLSSVEYMLQLPDGSTTPWTGAGREGIVSEATVAVAVDLPVGTTVVEWRARDAAGTPLQHASPITVTVDPPRGEDRLPHLLLASPIADGQYLAGVDIKLDAAASFDPEGRALSYAWWVDGVALEAPGAVAWVSLGPGRHAVTLVLSDGSAGAVVKTVEFTVNEPAVTPPALASPLEQALIVAVGVLSLLAVCVRGWADRTRRSLRR
jgi:hypothetical protein